MAAPVSTRLRDALRLFLIACDESLTAPPARQFISDGPPRVTCPLLAVYAGPMRALSLDQPSELPPTRPQPRVRVVTFNAELWSDRCHDADASPATLTDDGEAHMTAGWELFTGIVYRLATNTVFDTLTNPESAKTGNVDLAELLDPQTYAGWRLTVPVYL